MKPDVELIEYCTSSTTLVNGDFLSLKHDRVRLSNGIEAVREYVLRPGAVVVVPILPNGNVVLERQFRYPLNQVFIELPAGKIDQDEDILVTGKRELLEETGYTATQWVKLGQQHPCIGYSNEVIHMYMAVGLTAGKRKLDEGEQLEVYDMHFSACLDMAKRGEITDAKTLIALFLAEKYIEKHGLDRKA
jgi:ADP-ribose pyrophosphatase